MEEEVTGLDLISTLPDDILQRIGSAMPLEDAIKTSILSSRWRSLWAPSQLDFNIFHAAVVDPVKVVTDTFLRLFMIPEARKLCFISHNCSDPEINEIMTIMATKGVNKELHLHFSESKPKGFQLKLEPAPCLANLTILKTLHLRSVSSLGGGFVSALFSSCRLLETLNLKKCLGLESIEIEKNSSLRSLTISDCPNLETISVSAMEMTSFSYRGVLPRIQLKNTSNLTEVELDLTGSSHLGDFDCEEAISLFASMKEVEKLTISGWLLEWLCSGGVIYGRLEFQFELLKELRWIDASMNSSTRDSLACFLNMCPLLTNLFVNIDHSRSRVGCPMFHQHCHEPHLWMDFAAVKANVQPLKHLKTVGFVNVMEEESQIYLMDLLMEKAAASLESLSVTIY